MRTIATLNGFDPLSCKQKCILQEKVHAIYIIMFNVSLTVITLLIGTMYRHLYMLFLQFLTANTTTAHFCEDVRLKTKISFALNVSACMTYCSVYHALWTDSSLFFLVTKSYRLVAKGMPPTLRVRPNNLLEQYRASQIRFNSYNSYIIQVRCFSAIASGLFV